MKNEKNRYGKRVLAKNVVISDDTRVTGLNSNDLIIGGTGAGKTGSVVIPTIQNTTTSIVVSDTKAALEKRFRKELEEKGYEIHTIDFVNPERSCGYNPLDYVRQYPDGTYYEQDITYIARSIVPTLDKDEPFWELSAVSMVAFFIAYCLVTEPKEKRNMARVSELYHDYVSDSGRIMLDTQMWVKEYPTSFEAKKFREIISNKGAEKMYSSICGFVNLALEPFSMREGKAIFAKNEPYNIGMLGKKKSALFLNVSDTDPTFDIMVNVLYGQVLHHLCAMADSNDDNRLEMPVRIIMDDFAASARIENFDRITSVIRSRDIFVTIILQSLTQLSSMYNGFEANTIINNCDHILYMSGQDTSTIEYVASRVGKTPETVRYMPRDMAYLMENGKKGELVEKIKPYSTVADYCPQQSCDGYSM